MARSALTRSDLGDLNLFRTIARTGGFRRAALEIDVSASALRHALRGLETRLGVRLVNRTNRSVTLTEAGEKLLASLENGFEAIESGIEDLNLHKDTPSGRLRINVLTDAARLAFGPNLARFRAKYTQSVFWGSMAYTLIGGTAVGTVLILLFLPALYAAWFRIKPTAEEVHGVSTKEPELGPAMAAE